MTTPQEALERLKAGNERFARGQPASKDFARQRRETAGGQSPFAAVLGCIDSRVPPEIVFDQGVGDLFVARVAGNFANRDILGSLEFATSVMGCRLVAVLGHDACGAMAGACDGLRLGNLTATLEALQPAVETVGGFEGRRRSADPEFLRTVAEANVRRTVEGIPARSEVLRDLVERGRLLLRGAMYDVQSGRVSWLS